MNFYNSSHQTILTKSSKMEFELSGREFIELNKLLKLLNIAESGGMANQIIADGMITLNGEGETRKRCKIKPGDIIEWSEQNIKISIKA